MSPFEQYIHALWKFSDPKKLTAKLRIEKAWTYKTDIKPEVFRANTWYNKYWFLGYLENCSLCVYDCKNHEDLIAIHLKLKASNYEKWQTIAPMWYKCKYDICMDDSQPINIHNIHDIFMPPKEKEVFKKINILIWEKEYNLMEPIAEKEWITVNKYIRRIIKEKLYSSPNL